MALCSNNGSDSIPYDFAILLMKHSITISILVIFFSLPVEAQCAMCRAVLESDADGGMAQGVNNGIVYLMIFPYLLVGGVVFAVFRMLKKAKQNKNLTS